MILSQCSCLETNLDLLYYSPSNFFGAFFSMVYKWQLRKWYALTVGVGMWQ